MQEDGDGGEKQRGLSRGMSLGVNATYGTSVKKDNSHDCPENSQIGCRLWYYLSRDNRLLLEECYEKGSNPIKQERDYIDPWTLYLPCD